MRKPCKRCGEPKQPGRTTYCSDTCAAQAVAERMAARAARQMSGCRRCGAAKTPGIRGSKFCDECRRIVADQHTAHEAERKRRDHLASMEKARGERGQRRRTADVPDGQKWCPRCQDFRPLTSFPKRADRPVAAYCKPCQRAYNSERRLKLGPEPLARTDQAFDVKDDTARDALKFWTKHPAPGPWRLDGTCAQVDNGTGSDLWFSTDRVEQRQAKEICVTACPVFAECTAYWQATPGVRGIWGGTNDNDRRKWWRAREEEEEAAS